MFRFQHVRHSCLGKVKEFNFKSGKIYNFERRQGKVTVLIIPFFSATVPVCVNSSRYGGGGKRAGVVRV